MSRNGSRIDGMGQFHVPVAQFGRDVIKKLQANDGSTEDHLRAPLERMMRDVARSIGLSITMIGETQLPELSIRPDYAVDVAGARVGYLELKKPNHGVPDSWRKPTKHDKEQWEKLKLLPNVLYTDGSSFGLYHFGQRQGEVGRLAPGLERAGGHLSAVDSEFGRVVSAFLYWKPERPRTLNEVVRLAANLCRLLRDDVAAELVREQSGRAKRQIFSGLARDWRQALFPNLTDKQFADQYAQTVTFALLLARVAGVSFHDRSIGEVARLLGKKHSLMGKALAVLTDQDEEEQSVALATMLRVFGAVDWELFPEDSYAMLYEDFLAKYDPVLRRESGVYYTPAPAAAFVTRFVDDVLRTRLGRAWGFADDDVIVVDPAMGTGSFLAEVIDQVARTVASEEGEGSVVPRLRELSNRLIGFENQAAPYAVAELRIHSMLKKRHRAEVPEAERRFLADTLDDPNAQMLPMGSVYDEIEQSRSGANAVKRSEPVMVVIGNPPYGDKIKGTAPWIETASENRGQAPSLSAFRKLGNGRLEYVLSNKYVYFWRWATWKVFDAHPEHPAGAVAFVSLAGFTSGKGFAGMREYLRRTADEGWVIDLSPEGHQSPVNSRLFQGNQQPICIAVFVRHGEPDLDRPAVVRTLAIAGTRDEKCAALGGVEVDGEGWQVCAPGWGDGFRVATGSVWGSMPGMTDLMPWSSPGVKPNRSWVYAPDEASLRERWRRLVSASLDEKSDLFLESRDANLARINRSLPGIPRQRGPFSVESGSCPEPVRVAYRSFDRQFLTPDSRLIARPRRPLWQVAGDRQIFVTEQHAHPISGGPALTFTDLLPDNDHFQGHHGGRVLPLYRDSSDGTPNVAPGLLDYLGSRFSGAVPALDVLCYIAAITAHSAFTERFKMELKQPGVRVPLTSDRELWRRAVEIGREVLWLHTYGERCVDPQAGRPAGIPRMTRPPRVVATIPDDLANMPDRIGHDAEILRVGDGMIAPVSAEVWNYHVSGMRVVKHWFDYRKKKPSGNHRSELNKIVAHRWTAAMTTELLALLNVVGRCVELAPRQVALLDEVMVSELVSISDLESGGVLPVPEAAKKAPKVSEDASLWADAGETTAEF